MIYLLKKLRLKRTWKTIFYERLTEPMHLNFIAFWVFIFGSFKRKVDFDLVTRPEYAFGIMESALKAKEHGLKGISIIEFGVANGAGLMNMIEIAKKVKKSTGIEVKVYGFDTGTGMPKPVDYRDHPELYTEGDFPMNVEALKQSIEGEAELVLGNINEQIESFKSLHDSDCPIGFVSIDVDYYSSTVDALKIFDFTPEYYVPLVHIYLDDVYLDEHNSRCGELLAVNEWNERNDLRVIEHNPFIRRRRVFKNAGYIGQIYFMHVLDSAVRSSIVQRKERRVIENPYLKFEGNKNKLN